MSDDKKKGKKAAIKKRKKMKKKLKAKRAMKLLKLHNKGKIKVKGKGKSKSKLVTHEQQQVATAANLTSPSKQAPQQVVREEPRKGSLLNAILSYVILASLAAGAVALYQNWNGIMGKVAGTVCSNSLLGSYITPNQMALRGTVEPNMVATIAPTKNAESASVGLANVEPVKTEQANSGEAQTNANMQTAWMDARRAFWKDGASAETAYLDLVKNYPDQADIRGELGNIYFRTDRKEQAIDQYYKAGLTLIKSDNKDRALSVIEMLRELAPEKMQSLQEEYAKAG